MSHKIASTLFERNNFAYMQIPLRNGTTADQNGISDRVVYHPALHSDSSSEEEILFDMQYTDEVDKKEDGKTYTVEEAVEAIGFGRFQLRLYVVCGIVTAADALEMLLLAVLSPIVRCEWSLADYQVALITTVVFAGMGLMAPLWGFLGDRYGRKTAMRMFVAWVGYFGLLTSVVPNYTWILILRGLVGGGMAGSPQGFALLAEFLPSNHRAKVLITSSIFWAGGCIFEIFLASLIIPTIGWRWLLVFSAVPVLTAGLLLLCIPESARYLMAAGRVEEATVVLQKIAKENNSSLPEGKLVKSKEIQLGQFKDLFSSHYLRTTIQLWLLWFCAAFTYYGMILASAELLRNETKGSSKCKCAYLNYDDYMTMIISTVGEFLCLPINMLLIDRVGRKITGTVNLISTGVFFALLQIHTKRWMLTAIMFGVRGFAAATFTWTYIYTSEVYPTSIRTLGIGTASAWARIGAMITPFVAQVLLDYSVADATWVYGCICVVCGVSAMLLPIETRGRALPQSVSTSSFEASDNDKESEEENKEK
ncbi:hypothetical protein SNE40_002513 [Patella caerulea]|uniref:Major facilitator superfamily (MFS) profile domain-containing protein n=1 Tax=Patella caerulea TaxID=87958 RepID=A0AAN8KBZ6_PATCE